VLKSEYYYTPAITLVVHRKSGTETQLFHNEDLTLPGAGLSPDYLLDPSSTLDHSRAAEAPLVSEEGVVIVGHSRPA
jgi:hypothetical protein